MSGKPITTADLAFNLAKGWRPNNYLTSLSMAYFMKPEHFIGTRLFPVCPVSQSTSYFYTFSREDLARDNVKEKPQYGKVPPAVMGHKDDVYKCKVDQIIVGIDEIETLDYSRANTPGATDPRKSKVRFATEQMLLHLDITFAKKYFSKNVWENEWTGGNVSDSLNKKFLKFNDANFDPVNFFDARKKEMLKMGRREPNKLALGENAYLALKNHPDVLERIKYTGTTANPAIVTPNVLAQLFGIEEVMVMQGTYNKAQLGEAEAMDFICDENGALLCYVTNSPQIDEPSAGYTFTWDMLGNGNYMAMDQWPGESGTHSEFVEGLMSTDMRKTSDDLAMYFTDCADEIDAA